MTCAPSWTNRWRAGLCAFLCLTALPANAAFLEGEALDSVASVMALIVIFIVPIVGITLFWIVHVLPEKIAHKRHHPQRDAIHMLCLLSLAFGGLLWPLAFLWAYSKPVLHKLAYGTDKHEDYYKEQETSPPGGRLADRGSRLAIRRRRLADRRRRVARQRRTHARNRRNTGGADRAS